MKIWISLGLQSNFLFFIHLRDDFMFKNIFAYKLKYDPGLDVTSLKTLSFEIVQELNDQDFSDIQSLPCSFGWRFSSFFFNVMISLAIELLSTTMFYN